MINILSLGVGFGLIIHIIMDATNGNLTPYETVLLNNGDYIHQVIQDILNCKVEAIRKTSVRNMPGLLNLFIGSTPQAKKDQLLEFLRLLPEYKTTDQEVLYRRLCALQDHLRRTEGNSDLYFYAIRKYKNSNENNEQG